MDDAPRASTPEEIRDMFMDSCRSVADYWAGPLPEAATCRERIQGALHSWLCIIDGVSGMHGFDLVASPHPDDKEYQRENGENWSEPGTVINDTMLHALLPQHRG